MNHAAASPVQVRPAGGTTARGPILEIEVLRAVAILMVLVEHAPLNLVYWGGPFTLALLHDVKGWTGVDLFFVISGFVIARSLLPSIDATRLADSVPLLVRFWIRRAWRLFPSAWLWIALPFAACLVFNRTGAFSTVHANLEAGLAAFLDLANFHEAEVFGTRDSGVYFPYWSLSLEEQFYLVLPPALLLLRGWILLPIAWLVLATTHHPTVIGMMTRGGGLAMGVALALWERRAPHSYRSLAPVSLARMPAARIACLLVPILCLVALGSDDLGVVGFRLLPIDLLCLFLVWLAAYDRDLLWPDGAARRAMIWIGERSYALYLVHIPVYLLAHELYGRRFGLHARPHGVAQLVYDASALAACFVLADLNHRLLEVPLRERGRRIAAAWRPAS